MPKVTTIPATISLFTAAPIASKTKRKVAAYARVSTDHEDQLNSYEAQCDYYSNYIRKRDDWEFAGIYADEGISGTSTKKREKFNQMVKDAMAGRIELIVTKSVSRFARNTVDSLTTIRELKDHGVEVYFEKENIWTFDGKGELLLSIMSSLAQEESRSISQNVTWGWRKRFADGKVVMTFGSFLGYDRGEDGKPVINPEQAEIIRYIYGEFLAGLSYYAIAQKLMSLGIPSPRGKEVWGGSTVKSILTNEKYKGCALLQKSYTADYLTKKKVKNTGAVPMYYVEDSHPAIIEPDVFDHVQDLIVERGRRPGFSGTCIFASKIRCGECGQWFGSKVWHSTDEYRRVVWRCNNKYKDKKQHCSTPHVTEEEIKAAFLRMLNSMDRTALLEDLCEIRDSFSETDDLKDLDDRLNAEASAVNALVRQNARVAQNQDEYNRKYNEALCRYEATKAERDRAAAEKRHRNIRKREFDRFIKTLENVPEMVTNFDEALWASMVDYVTVFGKDDLRFTLVSGVEIKA